MRAVIITFLFMAVCWGTFWFSFTRDRSRYRNCYLLFTAIVSVFPFMINISGEHYAKVMVYTILVILAGLLITPFLLIINGFVMLKKEGRQLPHLLSLILGIVILLGEVSFIVNFISLYLTENIEEHKEMLGSVRYIAFELFGTTVVYGSMSVLIFVIYMLLLQLLPRKSDFDYVIILGAGLIDGEKVSKLLSDRLDKAIEVYSKDPSPTKLIPSGGMGGDEKISEAEAMKRYLIEKGIPEDDIIMEDKSTTTYENLTNSKQIIDSRGGRKKTALVSNNYHVYRALRYCRRLGFKCTGIGGHTASYFWPSALIREYIAVHAEKKHAVMFVLGWVACMVLAIIEIKSTIGML